MKNRKEYFEKYRSKNRLKLREYNKKYNKTWRKQHNYSTDKKFPEKRFAMQIVKILLQKGLLKKEKCLICKKIKTQAHHPDYNKPDLVVWLCPFHHRLIHRILKEKNGK